MARKIEGTIYRLTYTANWHTFVECSSKGAERFMRKHSDELSKEGYSCGYGGEPLWFW